MGKLTISMAIFNSYVKLPEGISSIGDVPGPRCIATKYTYLKVACSGTPKWSVHLWHTISINWSNHHMAVCQNLVPLVNLKIAGKWMFIPLKMVLIGIDPYLIDQIIKYWCLHAVALKGLLVTYLIYCVCGSSSWLSPTRPPCSQFCPSLMALQITMPQFFTNICGPTQSAVAVCCRLLLVGACSMFSPNTYKNTRSSFHYTSRFDRESQFVDDSLYIKLQNKYMFIWKDSITP